VYNDRNYHSTEFGHCGWSPIDQSSHACMFASKALSSIGMLRWNLGMAAILVVEEHLLLVEAVEATVVAAISLVGNSCQ